MTKQALLDQLKNDTLVMLRPSPVQGIGVFAISEIAKGRRGLFSNDNSKWLKIHKDEINQLPEHSKYLVENHCLYDDQYYFVPEYGFKMVDLVIYLNHSDTPNIVSINDGEDFEAIRTIEAGEELFVDYGDIVDAH